jgi:hypothetical protein
MFILDGNKAAGPLQERALAIDEPVCSSRRSASSVRPASPRPSSRAKPRFAIPRASVTAAATTVRPVSDANNTSPSTNTNPRPSPLTRGIQLC